MNSLPLDFDPEGPLERVLALGRTAVRRGTAIGLVVAIVLHGGAAARALSSPVAIRGFADHVRAAVHDYLWTTYDVELPKPPPDTPTPPPEKDETPPPAPVPRSPSVPKATPLPEAPPAAAQAGKILAADPDGPVDLTGEGFVTGVADSYAEGSRPPQATRARPSTIPTRKAPVSPTDAGRLPLRRARRPPAPIYRDPAESNRPTGPAHFRPRPIPTKSISRASGFRSTCEPTAAPHRSKSSTIRDTDLPGRPEFAHCKTNTIRS